MSEHILPIADHQNLLITEFLRLAKQCHQVVFLADDVSSHRPAIGLATDENTALLIAELLNGSGRPKICDSKKFTGFDGLESVLDKTSQGFTFYWDVFHQGILIHGAWSGIDIIFADSMGNNDRLALRRQALATVVFERQIATYGTEEFGGFALPVLPSCNEARSNVRSPRRVDVVYTWVNGDDTDWQIRKAKYIRAAEQGKATQEALHFSRFRSNNELLYSLRSLYTYMKGLGQVFVVTENQRPDFIGEFPDVKIIDHSEIFREELFGAGDIAPSYNSHAIGAALPFIKGLSTRFLYVNDDIIFSRAFSPALFFDEFGRAKYSYSGYASIASDELEGRQNAAGAAAVNNRQLILDRFGHYIFRKYRHCPIAGNVDVYTQMMNDFPEAYQRTVRNRVRSDDDNSIAGHLYYQYSSLVGASVMGNLKYDYFVTDDEALLEKVTELASRSDVFRPDLYCVNETSFAPPEVVDITPIQERLHPTLGAPADPGGVLDESGEPADRPAIIPAVAPIKPIPVKRKQTSQWRKWLAKKIAGTR